MTKGQLLIFLLVLVLAIVNSIVAHLQKRFFPFMIIEFILGVGFLVLGGWFAYDCLVPKQQTDGFLLTPVIRFVLQNDHYSYQTSFWPAICWIGALCLICFGTVVFLLTCRKVWLSRK